MFTATFWMSLSVEKHQKNKMKAVVVLVLLVVLVIVCTSVQARLHPKQRAKTLSEARHGTTSRGLANLVAVLRKHRAESFADSLSSPKKHVSNSVLRNTDRAESLSDVRRPPGGFTAGRNTARSGSLSEQVVSPGRFN